LRFGGPGGARYTGGMNEDLPTVTPQALPGHWVTEEDIRAFVKGMEPGWYTSRDLHPRYAAWAERESLPVASIKTLGESIRRHVKMDNRHTHGHVKVWFLPEELTGAP
jgi:hypothetical protein